MTNYNHKEIEKKWANKWQEWELYKTKEDQSKPKYYILDMFPYVSGEGLHIGHPKGYTATDIFARAKAMQGYNVLHPMGWDAFGLPTENYAIKNKIHPKIVTERNVKIFKEQLQKLGFNYDWDKEINTTDPNFYKWTQWCFLKMFEKGLAYESFEPINWCPGCQTGLANEDLEDGKCERCGSEIERKPMRQWMLKITDYADRLLDDLDKLPDWEESIKEMQRNWIGRSEGAEINFEVRSQKSEAKSQLKVFTTRPDTLFGATYMVIAPEHEIINNLEFQVSNLKEVREYIERAKNKSDLERTDLAKEKTGVKLEGIVAVNPANGEEIPVYIADYVLSGYGTGAIMAVPAHDERDFEFAKKYNINVKNVMKSGIRYVFQNKSQDIETVKKKYEPFYDFNVRIINGGTNYFYLFIPEDFYDNILKPDDAGLKYENFVNDIFSHSHNDQVYELPWGIMMNSDKYNGMFSLDFKKEIIKNLEIQGKAKFTVNYKLNDWVFSRQRYWGEPIPLIHCEKCGVVPVPENELPLELPDVEHYEPSGTGESPLATMEDWVNTVCPKCGGPAKRETNTMPQWAGSSWYYLRYIDPQNDTALVDKNKEKYWSPVDFYVGGAEHATRHLIYARFWHKFLFDIGVVNYEEPFTRLLHVGLILAEDGRKMSKRWGNVINPNEIVENYGADALRVYEMFMGPFSQPAVWSTNGLIGTRKFLDRIWNLMNDKELVDCGGEESCKGASEGLPRLLHQTIKKVTEDIENFHFNTAISAMMIFANFASKFDSIPRAAAEKFLVLLSPFAPHLAEEIWFSLGHSESIFKQPWPKYDPELAKEEMIRLVLQVNGKLRDTVEVSVEISEEEAKELAIKNEKIIKWTEGKEIKKVIFVKGRLVNIVVE